MTGAKLSVLCFGMGAIGSYIGGSLALAGNRVVFIDKPEVAAQVKSSGLRIFIQEKQHSINHPLVVSSLEEALEAGPYDVALLAVKSFDTQSVINQINPFKEKLPPILCLQNGVENEGLLAEALGENRVIAGTVTSAVGRRGVGEIVLEKLRGVGLAGNNPLIPILKDVFEFAGLQPKIYRRPDSMKWSKLLTNLQANASSAILDMSPTLIFSHFGLFQLELSQLREALAVMEAQKIPVIDLPGTPARLFAFGIRFLPAAISQPIMIRALGKGRGEKMPSFHIDLRGGRKSSEVDYLNGAVVRFGERYGIPTPVNRFLNRLLMEMVQGHLPINTFSHHPETLLEKFQQERSS